MSEPTMESELTMESSIEEILQNLRGIVGTISGEIPKNKKILLDTYNTAKLTQPNGIHFADGSEKEYWDMVKRMEKTGTAERIPGTNSINVSSTPEDVARVEEQTFIATETKEEAGPTNNWKETSEARKKVNENFTGTMQGRTMFVVPYAMGPKDSPLTQYGVEFTDSPYVVATTHLMQRIGQEALKELEQKEASGKEVIYLKGVHSVGVPIDENGNPIRRDVENYKESWPCNPKNIEIVGFTKENEVWSFGSGYGGNAILGKKWHSLRIATVLADGTNRIAEHMAFVIVTDPDGNKYGFLYEAPSQCGKSNNAMLLLPDELVKEGWKLEMGGDDIIWGQIGEDGNLYVINPEDGIFAVGPGSGETTNPNFMRTVEDGLNSGKRMIFTNLGKNENGRPVWQGMDKLPEKAITWLGQIWTPGCGKLLAHSNGRVTISKHDFDILSPDADKMNVPIRAILVGARRSKLGPVVVKMKNWLHGVWFQASNGSETTAAAKGEIGKLRRDPMANLPFCGYHIAKYFQHHLNIGKRIAEARKKLAKKLGEKLPDSLHIFGWNVFLKNEKGEFVFPGFRKNGYFFVKIAKYIQAQDQIAKGEIPKEPVPMIDTPIGRVFNLSDKELDRMGVAPENRNLMKAVDLIEWIKEIKARQQFLRDVGAPEELIQTGNGLLMKVAQDLVSSRIEHRNSVPRRFMRNQQSGRLLIPASGPNNQTL